MSQAPQIGTIASNTDKLSVQRLGEQIVLRQGDAVLAGDVLQNKDDRSVDIELPAQKSGQSDSLLTLAPDATAQVLIASNDDGAIIEVTSLTEGVELYAVSEGSDGAMLLADAGTGVSGLVGAGLLSAGSIGGTSGLVTAIGGGVGVAALAASSGDDSNSANPSGFTDVRVDNGDETTPPVDNPENPEDPENPDSNENPDTPTEEEPETPVENPEQPTDPVDPGSAGTTGTPLDLLLDPLASALGGTPLAVITDPLFDALGALPIGSAPNPANALPLDAITGNLPG
ncbi:hypothetical protein EV673_3055 [Limnobacter thiooxidans]|uniref:Uncharacterized protein n=1 Tax=Limnobacter thiooxidans TaxID=131080 RepID=A0AA86M803_9BURK|nr:hypothetical protein EV673_3055 [Limnobacter thiooxidans]BET24884.1 hypothetical protein RGQ30_03850 [Limnobacter thiooxidans]